MRTDLNISFESGLDFWKNLSNEKYFHTKNEIYKLLSMSGSTYNCESSFSILGLILTKHRSSLTNEHIESLLRIKCCTDETKIDNVLHFIKNV